MPGGATSTTNSRYSKRSSPSCWLASLLVHICGAAHVFVQTVAAPPLQVLSFTCRFLQYSEMNVALLRVGVDSGCGGIQGPVFATGDFEFIPIPDDRMLDIRTYGNTK